MKIRLMGTSAGMGWPHVFSRAYGSNRSMELGGKNIRSRSSLLVDDYIKIDFPADTFHQMVTQQVALNRVKYLFLTRSSYPNLAVDELSGLLHGVVEREEVDYLRVFGNPESVEKIKTTLKGSSISYFEIQPFQTIQLGAYLIHPIRAHNNGDREPLNYLIRKGAFSVLYASDTGIYDEPSFRFLRHHRLDAVLCGCACGTKKSNSPYRMGFPDALRFKQRCEKEGITDEDTRWYLTQLSHSDGILHEEFEDLVQPFGFEVAWDGMELEF